MKLGNREHKKDVNGFTEETLTLFLSSYFYIFCHDVGRAHFLQKHDYVTHLKRKMESAM